MHTELPGPLLYTSEEVLNAIKNIDKVSETYKDKYNEFYNRFCHLDDGYASKRVVDKVFNK
jgi:CDP-glycerol glycerophosphotransferase